MFVYGVNGTGRAIVYNSLTAGGLGVTMAPLANVTTGEGREGVALDQVGGPKQPRAAQGTGTPRTSR